MLAAMGGLQLGFTLFYILVCILLVGVVLLQKGRGGGIGAAFGGGASTSPFGAKTGDVFTWVTVVLAGLAILIGVVGNYVLLPTIATEGGPGSIVPGEEGAIPPAEAPPGTTPLTPTPAPTGPPPGQSAPAPSPGRDPAVPSESAAPTGGAQPPSGAADD